MRSDIQDIRLLLVRDRRRHIKWREWKTNLSAKQRLYDRRWRRGIHNTDSRCRSTEILGRQRLAANNSVRIEFAALRLSPKPERHG